MNTLLAIFIGGGLGSVVRFSISRLVVSDFKSVNPKATLIANLISTLFLGVIIYLSTEKIVLTPNLKALLIVGFCGGFSTFSTFSYETFELLRMGNYLFAGLNVIISVVAGVGVLFFLSKML